MSHAHHHAVLAVAAPAQAKHVLHALATRANGAGACWPSIPRLSLDTGLSQSTVHRWIGWLDREGLIAVTRAEGKAHRYALNLAALQQAARRPTLDTQTRVTSVTVTPVEQSPKPHDPCQRDTGDPCHSDTGDQHHSDTGPLSQRQGTHVSVTGDPCQRDTRTDKEQAKNRKSKRASKSRSLSVDPQTLMPDVERQTMDDWLAVRKAKRAGPLTATAVRAIRMEAQKADRTVQEVVATCAARSWVSFKASWDAGENLRNRDAGIDRGAI